MTEHATSTPVRRESAGSIAVSQVTNEQQQ